LSQQEGLSEKDKEQIENKLKILRNEGKLSEQDIVDLNEI
jgi:hypothetical protein